MLLLVVMLLHNSQIELHWLIFSLKLDKISHLTLYLWDTLPALLLNLILYVSHWALTIQLHLSKISFWSGCLNWTLKWITGGHTPAGPSPTRVHASHRTHWKQCLHMHSTPEVLQHRLCLWTVTRTAPQLLLSFCVLIPTLCCAESVNAENP